jgi:methylated-DNA-[protein]-cysteine S-methyltransferase
VHRIIDSPLGPLTLAGDGAVLTGVYFDRPRHRPAAAALGPRVAHGFETAIAQLEEYFAGGRTAFDLPLRPPGSPFQQQVWNLVRRIPYGETRTYGGLAAELGDPAKSRAVGAANGRNPLPIIVPCHRVIGADGRLTGYGGGLERKRLLLGLERSAALVP